MPKTRKFLKNKLVIRLLLVLGGAAYVTTFSQLDIHILLKPYLALVPVQAGALLYLFYLKKIAPQLSKPFN